MAYTTAFIREQHGIASRSRNEVNHGDSKKSDQAQSYPETGNGCNEKDGRHEGSEPEREAAACCRQAEDESESRAGTRKTKGESRAAPCEETPCEETGCEDASRENRSGKESAAAGQAREENRAAGCGVHPKNRKEICEPYSQTHTDPGNGQAHTGPDPSSS